MQCKDFLETIIDAYRKARKPLYQDDEGRIKRGRSRSIASEAEELLAAFLSCYLSNDYEFYIDQPINVNGETYYPDIMLVNSSKLNQIVDVKMDLGWKRDKLEEFCKNKRDMIRKIRGKEGSLKIKETKSSKTRVERMNFSISGSCSYHVVIISGENIKSALRDRQLNTVMRCQPEVYTYLLSKGVHPNEYGDDSKEQLLKRITVDEEQFADLLKNLASSDVPKIKKVPDTDHLAPVASRAGSRTPSSGKDYSKYIFNGTKHNKNGLVHAVVRKYLQEHPKTTYAELLKVFPDNLHSSRYGVFRKANEAQNVENKTGYRRFFTHPVDLLQTADGIKIAVCTQWGGENFIRFLDYVVNNLKYKIEKVDLK
ncbi:MAG: hypothetical protein IT362_10915 [Deltaproteobacteria bacterium]|nr:hypothetical protein [Deltaproteobacteria bacterium]